MKNVGMVSVKVKTGQEPVYPPFCKNQALLPMSKDTCPGGLWVFNKLFLRETRGGTWF